MDRVIEDYHPPKDALSLALSDKRVSDALDDENAYWRTDEIRLGTIRQRCIDANLTPDS